MRILATVARIALGLIFLAAAWDKIANPAAFAKIIHNYQILPDVLVNGLALTLPWLEVVVGACLLVGFAPRGASLAACLLMVVFLGATGYAYSKGLDTQCGCFTTKTDEAISANTFIRDGTFLVLALIVAVDSFWRPRER